MLGALLPSVEVSCGWSFPATHAEPGAGLARGILRAPYFLPGAAVKSTPASPVKSPTKAGTESPAVSPSKASEGEWS